MPSLPSRVPLGHKHWNEPAVFSHMYSHLRGFSKHSFTSMQAQTVMKIYDSQGRTDAWINSWVDGQSPGQTAVAVDGQMAN